jgi:hypothetical protein
MSEKQRIWVLVTKKDRRFVPGYLSHAWTSFNEDDPDWQPTEDRSIAWYTAKEFLYQTGENCKKYTLVKMSADEAQAKEEPMITAEWRRKRHLRILHRENPECYALFYRGKPVPAFRASDLEKIINKKEAECFACCIIANMISGKEEIQKAVRLSLGMGDFAQFIKKHGYSVRKVFDY